MDLTEQMALIMNGLEGVPFQEDLDREKLGKRTKFDVDKKRLKCFIFDPNHRPTTAKVFGVRGNWV